MARPNTTVHLVIPDTQIGPGAPTQHLRWIGQYIVDQFASRPLKIIHLGDHWDMPSLSSYDRKGGSLMEGRRVITDIEAGNEAFKLLTEPLRKLNRKRQRQYLWTPELHLLRGNHENRIVRAVEQDAQLEGFLSLDLLKSPEWTVHDFLEPVRLDGVVYSHYLYNTMTGRPLGGSNLETRLKNVGHSFTVGHAQGLKWARIDTLNGPHIGLQAGSCYLHEERYLGPQATGYWRGIIVCHQVENGDYDPMFVSLDYLCRRYEGVPLERFLR